MGNSAGYGWAMGLKGVFMTSTEIKQYIETGTLPPIRKLKKTEGSICKCGKQLTYTISPYLTTERRLCPKCGVVHYVDYAPMDFKKVFEL